MPSLPLLRCCSTFTYTNIFIRTHAYTQTTGAKCVVWLYGVGDGVSVLMVGGGVVPLYNMVIFRSDDAK